MKEKLFAVLICPRCKTSFIVWDGNQKWENTGSNLIAEIQNGLLRCENNHFFPIIKGIPRIFSGALDIFSNGVIEMSESLPPEWESTLALQENKPDKRFANMFARTQQSFSSEWEGVGGEESAWGQDVNERLRLFLSSFETSSNQLDGKKVLDAGCGHGETVLALAKTHAEVFGCDLSFAIDDVSKRIQSLPANVAQQIHLVQTNLSDPPFKDGVFDFVYSAGVLHHTPDTHHSFKQIALLVKQSGKCFIEVYSNEFKNPVELAVHYLFRTLRTITTLLPLPVLHFLCWVLALPSWLYIHFFNWITRNQRYVLRSLSLVKLSLFDALSPRFDWHHTTKEVMNWFTEAGYSNLNRTYTNLNGIGVVGKKGR